MDEDQIGAIDTAADSPAPSAPLGDNSGAPPVMSAPPDNSGAAPVMPSGGAIQTDTSDAGQQAQAPAPAAGQGTPAPTQGPPSNGGQSQSGADFNAAHVPGNVKKIISYLMGSDAVHPQVLDQLAQQVDPDGSMPQGDRNLLALDRVRDTKGDAAAWQVMQANRVAYNAQTAFAKTALMGTQQKPADLNAAIDAANKAQANVLDGSNVHFTQARGGGGVTATVSMHGADQPQVIQLSQQAFAKWLDVGGDGQWDKVVSTGAPATLQRLAQTNPVPQAAAPARAQKTNWGTGADKYKAPAASAPDDDEQPETYEQQQARAPDSNAVGTGQPQAMDATEGDQPAISGTHDAHGHYVGAPQPDKTDFGEELEARGAKQFPSVGQAQEKQAWMGAQEQTDLERENKIAVAGETGKAKIRVAEATGRSRENAATTAAGAKVQSSQNYSAARVQAAEVAAQGRDKAALAAGQKSNLHEQMATYRTKQANGIKTTPAEDANYNKLVESLAPQQQQQAPAQQTAPSQAQPQAAPARPANVPQGAKFYKGSWYTRGANGEAVPVQ